MSSLQTANFGIVISGLEKSAEQLKNQNKEEAQKIILGISSEIHFLAAVSREKESEYKQAQQNMAEKISEIISKEADIRNSVLNINTNIEKLNVEMSKEEANQTALLETINLLKIQLDNTQNQIMEHKAKVEELNDTSAESIFISILSLGLDRTIMEIQTLINDDAGHIQSLNDELSTYQDKIYQEAENIRKTEDLLNILNEQKRSSDALVAELSKREIDLQEEEKSCRQRVVYFTNVALFYGKLLIMSQQIEHKIDDVIDIVEELDDSSPTIIDFDSSGKDLISLRQSLEKFDQLVSDEPA